MGLMEQFANPDTMHSLSMGDKLAGAGITTLMGMGITFLILLLLWALIAIMTKIITSASKDKKKSEATTPVAAPVAAAATSAPAAASAETTEPANDANLVAVIAAAIAAYEGEEIASNLVVKRIRRVAGPTAAWAREGRDECIESRRV